MASILITGGTGLVGTALTKALRAQGREVGILTRQKPAKPVDGVAYHEWDPSAQTIDSNGFDDAVAIVNLAGANVAGGRWTASRKKEILDSRVQSGTLLVKALTEIPNRIRAVVSMSAVGWYGADPVVPNPRPFIETDPADGDFLGKTCEAWEDAIAPVSALGKRLVILRTGIVLSTRGGAYHEFRKPFRFGLAGTLGSGRQIVSWIHIDDLVTLIINAVDDERRAGIYNAVADVPVANGALIEAIRASKRGVSIPVRVPALALRLGLGEMSVEVLKSATVSNAKLREEGIRFRYPTIDAAVARLEAGEKPHKKTRG
ncbi:MAG: hypothetical protein JWP27_1216 [Flaviaesturariibacter sp.]|nr:hypothetical protein [Flaviaesturariibacter sp.]